MDGGFLEIAQQCAPKAEAAELAAIVSVESGFNPLIIRINSDKALASQPQTKAEAIEIATALQIDSQDADLGLGGLSLRSIGQLGLTISDAFDPCKNLAASAQLLANYYASARAGSNDDPKAYALWTYFGRGDPEPGRIVGYDRIIAGAQAKLSPKLNEITFQTGKSFQMPVLNGNPVNPVARLDEGTDLKAGQDGPPSQRNGGEPKTATPAPQQDASSSWDVFSSTSKSQLIIFNRQQENSK